jgi:type II secretory pathway component PulF
MALRAGELAAQEAERGLKTLVTLLEPALILAFGGLVAFVAVALLQAVYSVRPM